MKSVIEILEELEGTSGRLAKEAILEENSSNELLQDVFKAAFDPYVHYGVKKFKMPKTPSSLELDDNEMLSQFVYELLPKLFKRDLSGNAAKAAIEGFIGDCNTKTQMKWLKRILLQNLRCGVQRSTCNKTWENLIPKFEVQLAKSLEASCTENDVTIEQTINYPVRIEPKLDGLRCIAIKHNGVVTMYTRNGREIENLPTIVKAIEDCNWDNFVFDGEAMGEDWNESASIIGSKKNTKSDKNMFLNVFDAMAFEDWKAQSCEVPMVRRSDLVRKLVKKCMSKHVQAVPFNVAENERELIEYYLEQVEQDFEGIMVKELSGLYEFKRTKAMLKMKPVTTYEGVVVGAYEGRDGTQNAGVFGGFEIILPNGVVTRVGGGYDNSERADFQLTGPATYVGKIMEVEGQPPLTKEGRVRFPVFIRWRDDSDVDPLVMKAYEEFTKK